MAWNVMLVPVFVALALAVIVQLLSIIAIAVSRVRRDEPLEKPQQVVPPLTPDVTLPPLAPVPGTPFGPYEPVPPLPLYAPSTTVLMPSPTWPSSAPSNVDKNSSQTTTTVTTTTTTSTTTSPEKPEKFNSNKVQKATNAPSVQTPTIPQFPDLPVYANIESQLKQAKEKREKEEKNAAKTKEEREADGLEDWRMEMLAVHNRYRAEKNVPPLVWSEKMEKTAREWIEKQTPSAERIIPHRSWTDGVGENIAWLYNGSGDRRGDNPETILRMWTAEEEPYYDPATGKCANDNLALCGHYTQVMWTGSKEVGCAKGPSRDGSYTHTICNYSPPGNMTGQRPYE